MDPVALIKRFCSKGDHNAFNRFYRAQADRLWRFLCARGASPEQAYDLLSESFERFIKNICKDPAAPVAYLYRIAVNLHIDSHRREQARPAQADTEAVEAHSGPGQATDEREWVRRLVNKLPQDEQNLLLMRYWIGLTHREIAETTGLPEGTVRRQAAASLKKLRQYWPEDE